MNVSFEEFIKLVKLYNPEEVEIVTKAYEYAKDMHGNQLRESGDEYITHPLNVAYILAEMHADRDTLCAALLHDTLEDTKSTKDDLIELFNKNVAALVDGVTKISKMNFSTKIEENSANTRKIVLSLSEDVRIIIIKLADRLHNMRTLEYKTPFKQKENALETMEIFVPLAYYIGAYRIKSELEDICLKYLKPEMYNNIKEKKKRIEVESTKTLSEMLCKIKEILENENISNDIKVRTKNIYGIYKKITEGYKISDIHDLLSLKIMVDDMYDCYKVLGLVHSKYKPINNKFKDYICNPKTNMYRSLHTTVFGPEERIVQTQIRTFDMDLVASFGLTAYWDINKGEARNVMQKDLKNNSQFLKSLLEINSIFGDNQEFVSQVKKEIFSGNIYVYTPSGIVVEMPKGSTIIDLAFKLGEGYILTGAIINGNVVNESYELQNKDRVTLLTDELSYGPRTEWEGLAKTSYAKKMIKEFNK